ncbi:MAG: molecular chaperone HtpG [Sulfurospirillum sp.]|nr:molecular chaperone HtpG [Sulfurospirillum sp.]
MAKHQFQTEVTQLLDLMIHSLYSNKEIFLRELISNASDALDKLNYLTLTDENFKNLSYTPKIEIGIDKEAKTLTISDSGIGMNEEDLVENLGTIAKSGTKSFIQNLSGDAKKDSSLIGQFGVGFYSAFMVANKIEVTSKKAGQDEAYTWVSEAGGEYEITPSQKETHGTSITLHLKDDENEFLEFYRIEGIIKKYSNHIPFGIWMDKEETKYSENEDEEPTKEIKNVQINKASALWRVGKNDIKDEEYKDFYKQISHDSSDPFLWIHTKAEGKLEYNTLFYIPSVAPMDLFRVDFQPGVKLYVKRVFITDDEKELLPIYLRFVRGIIDAEDLPLNVSREILQQNRILESIKKASVKKILGELKKFQKDTDKYLEFYKKFGRVLKEGLYGDFENRDAILDLVLFKSSKRDGLISLKEYKEAMHEDQKSIYYIAGEDEALLRNSPLIEQFKAKDIEVLLLDEEVDAIVMPMVHEYDKTPIKPVNNSDIDEEIKDEKEENKEQEASYLEVIVKMKEILKDVAKDVKISSRLSDSPSVLIYDKNDPDFQMQQMLKQMGQDNLPKVKPILEVNPKHEIFVKLMKDTNATMLNDVAYLLMDQAKLAEGMKLDDISGFAKRLNKIIAKAL